ncbi:hypothetical protein C8T65DRAFT_119141 [Cerioporus squamosus]|nr:hypothetical protein C8T65DRAFT_119141 [Cerioporus squamosus]
MRARSRVGDGRWEEEEEDKTHTCPSRDAPSLNSLRTFLMHRLGQIRRFFTRAAYAASQHTTEFGQTGRVEVQAYSLRLLGDSTELRRTVSTLRSLNKEQWRHKEERAYRRWRQHSRLQRVCCLRQALSGLATTFNRRRHAILCFVQYERTLPDRPRQTADATNEGLHGGQPQINRRTDSSRTPHATAQASRTKTRKDLRV